jgi:hypothetical protein
MAQIADNVHVGPARIFLGITNPASSIPPTWMTHTAGVPTPGTEVGYTDGDAVFRKSKETFEVNAEQALGPIAVGLTREVVEVEFVALERVYLTLQAAMDNVGTVNDATRMGFFGGGLQYALRTQTVFLSSPRPNQAGKYEISVIYKAYNVSPYEIGYRKGGASSLRMILRGLMDTSRVVGDQLFQHYIEK